jgi:transcriptional regulator with XRE-family HTH domain
MSEQFTAEQLHAIRKKEKANILKKVQSGGTLTQAERLILYGNTTDQKRYAKNQTELAELLGVDRKTIQRWRKEENFPKAMADGRYDIIAVRDWRERTRSSSTTDAEDLSKAEGEARRVWLQVEKLEHEIEVSKGKFISIEQAQQDVAQMCSRARSILLAIPDTLAPLVIGKTPTQAQQLIRKEIDNALAQISSDQVGL